ncbi:hypothetical protein ABFO59_05145 [Acinetobacter radioresistens]|uniref:hypothetical protein n=1 Tax=Acinetobacter radioresistens TaxID=40216 RepID=UPI0032137B11
MNQNIDVSQPPAIDETHETKGLSEAHSNCMDMFDAVSLAKTDLEWSLCGLSTLKMKLNKIKESSLKAGIHPYSFRDIDVFMEMLEFTLEHRFAYWEGETEDYEAKLNKFGVVKNA